MAKHIHIFEVSNFAKKSVVIKGWLENIRSSGSIVFMQIRDGTGTIQGVVVKDEVEKKVFSKACKLTLESSVIVRGEVKKDKRAPSGYELGLESIEVVHLSDIDYPIGKKKHGVDFLLSNRHLWIRTKRQWAILKVRAKIFEAIETFYKKEGFVRVDTPIITPNACEGTTTLFEIDYFGEKAYLTQSGQLYLEAAIYSFGKVYDFTPVFRAEKSKTRRHLIEFWMTNAEIPFCDLEGLIDINEKMIDFILRVVLKDCRSYLEILGRNLLQLEKIKPPYHRITYEESLKVLKKLGSDISWGEDFGNDDETIFMNHFKKPVFVTHYPAEVKAFYMKKDPYNDKLVLCVDLLAPEGYGEIIGGSVREDDHDLLLARMKKHKLPISEYQWYLDLRKYGSVPHGGFGLGPERLIAWICGLSHVRETIPFPRLLGRFKP